MCSFESEHASQKIFKVKIVIDFGLDPQVLKSGGRMGPRKKIKVRALLIIKKIDHMIWFFFVAVVWVSI